MFPQGRMNTRRLAKRCPYCRKYQRNNSQYRKHLPGCKDELEKTILLKEKELNDLKLRLANAPKLKLKVEQELEQQKMEPEKI